MALDFNVKDILHKIQVKFIHAFLPDAKKPYNLKAVHQQELDIHGIASKADVYNIGTSARVIEEGLTAGMELIKYLVADGFRIKTPLFNVKVCVPGEYDGSETRPADGAAPVARIQTSSGFRKYLKEMVTIEFGGIDQSDGLIAEALDEVTELADEAATRGNLLTIHGFGLKIEGDEGHRDSVGLYFEPEGGGAAVKAEIIAVNEPRTLKVIAPLALEEGKKYVLKAVTQGSAKTHSHLLKELRAVRSEFLLTAHT
ncbi:MAG: DUF4469 domain-containing protein [Treponema sp.]|jgi:hypothetical protein|nr:DUF4469 domain-containing protein [Treponema sp.]